MIGLAKARRRADDAAEETEDTSVETTDGAESDTSETEFTATPVPTVPENCRRNIAGRRLVVCGLVPALALGLAVAAGFLKWRDSSARDAQVAAVESVQAATDTTIKMLSYRPDTVDADLASASDRLTGSFRDSYTSLTHDVVIPGAKQKQISSTATVPAAASVSASQNQAVVLVFVDQAIIVGSEPPSSTASCVKVTLDKVGDRWLVSEFSPV